MYSSSAIVIEGADFVGASILKLRPASFTALHVDGPKAPITVPKFLLGDNTDHPEDIFIVHTEYPHFIINLLNDDIEWFDELRGDESEIAIEIAGLIEEASIFYDREMERYTED